MTSAITQIRVCGLVGILAATIMFASDCVVMDSSASGAEYGYVSLDRMTGSPNWRLTLGGLGGPVGACFFVIGFAHVYLALRPGGKHAAFLCAAGFAAGYIILGAWHAAFPLFAFINRMQPGVDDPTAHEGWEYLMNIGFVGVVPAVCSILILPALILFRASRYPKWFAFVNPGLIFMCTAVFKYAPAPIGGFLIIGSGSLSFLAFFTISAIVLWNGGRQVRTDAG